ncbi:TlpA family protein disulfide reductase [Pseudomonas sp. S75]|uniref:TlpA disulfide reductase family protein n=1 Tax=unclassified Pseudomonas TaxID=196821 RepID=UPI001905B7BC|nr:MULTISPECIES: TlpA disulfide reductase family protein [unclassified Pseudomonas]MBJ9975341.1 TlpA family protein disulfide reductase [Pseudomonas sp. S30]MBK0152685.1 TlpA family protein disulfide reductase [Pseudomonas sp. S75]
MLTITLGPLTMALNHLLLLAALGVACLVGWWVARRGGENPEAALFNLFLAGVLCARLGFVLQYWSMYQNDPLQMIDIRDGGFQLWGGLAGIVAATLWQVVRRPGLRVPLGWAVMSGALFWGLTSLGSHLYDKGTELPDLTLRTASGEPVALQTYRGKPLVVNIWATWCPPCRREMPVLQQAQGDHPDVTFVFVNQGETAETVSTFLATTGLSLTHVLFDGSGQLAQRVGSMALPTTLFYDAQGRLVGSHLGELSRASLHAALADLTRAIPPDAHLSRGH